MMNIMKYPFHPLPTDIFFYAIVLLIILGACLTALKPHLCEPWRRVFRRPLGMVSVVIILCYLLIGLLDSVHFKYSRQPDVSSSSKLTCPSGYGTYYPANFDHANLSLLDAAFFHVNAISEKRYSAPLALTEFDSRNHKREGVFVNGKYFPRLCYVGGDTLSSSHAMDIMLHILKGVGQSFAVLLSLMLLIFLVRWIFHWFRSHEFVSSLTFELCRWKRLLSGSSPLAWRSAIFTVSGIVTLFFILAQLSLKYHVFGTDKIGVDVFYVSLKSIRTGLLIGFISILFMLPFALLLGLLAGYFGGWVDDIIQYVYTTVSSIPGVLLISACLLILRAYLDQSSSGVMLWGYNLSESVYRDDLQFLGLCAILGLTGWAGLCRLLRAETIKLRGQPFVVASRSLGQRPIRILFKHILPNVVHIILITVVLDFSGLVLAEAVLTYVGVGVPSSIHSWGNMINAARLELSRAHAVWWPLVSAMFFMFVFVLSINLFADVVRDAFDPRCK